MSTLFSATRGPCLIEITNADGEKISYNAIITQHQIEYGSKPLNLSGKFSIDDFVSPQVMEVTLKFKEYKKREYEQEPKQSSIEVEEML